eukprot:10576520-Ditylum_brightwellii.AAC.1
MVYLSDVSSCDEETGDSLTESFPIMCESGYESCRNFRHLCHGQQPEGTPVVKEPILEPYRAADDQYLPMTFQGEEINMGLHGFTCGYDYYASAHSVCFHIYTIGIGSISPLAHRVPQTLTGWSVMM